MKPTILLLTLLFAPGAPAPDLCVEQVLCDATGDFLTDNKGTTLSASCAWAGPDAPVWANTACCSVDGSNTSCVTPDDRGQCPLGFPPYFCEYGEELNDGGLLCYQSFPSACEHTTCGQSTNDPQVQDPDDVQEDVICCIFGTCYEWDDLLWEDCEGSYGWCDDGYSKLDGTVECFD